MRGLRPERPKPTCPACSEARLRVLNRPPDGLAKPSAGAALAQPVEHRIRNAGVRCSSHLGGTIFRIEDNFSRCGVAQEALWARREPIGAGLKHRHEIAGAQFRQRRLAAERVERRA